MRPVESRPSLSVVIPARNAEATISKAILSIQSQTVKPSEIIVVDDGSTDRTVEVSLATGVPFTPIRKESVGPGEARNAGVRASQADVIAFLDSDDTWDSNHLDTVLTLLVGHPSAVGIFTSTHVSRRSNCVVIFESLLSLLPSVKMSPFQLLRQPWKSLYRVSMPSFAVRRSAFVSVGGFPPESYGEDRALWFRLTRVGAFAVSARRTVRLGRCETGLTKSAFEQRKHLPAETQIFDKFTNGAEAAAIETLLTSHELKHHERQEIAKYLDWRLIEQVPRIISRSFEREASKMFLMLRPEASGRIRGVAYLLAGLAYVRRGSTRLFSASLFGKNSAPTHRCGDGRKQLPR